MKRLGLPGKVMSVAALSAVLLGAIVAPSADPYRVMIGLESRRSLGNGKLAEYLGSSDPIVAVRAALAIGRTRHPEGAPLLAGHLADERTGVRAMAVYGMGLISAPGYGPALLKAVGDPQAAVRAAALDALARYAAAKAYAGEDETIAAAGAVIHVLQADADPVLRGRAATALVDFKSAPHASDAAQALGESYARETDRSVRWHVMWAIYRGYSPGVAIGVVGSALHDPDELVRIEAVRAMSHYKV